MNGILNEQSLIYRQIEKLIEDGILQGSYAEGEQVPSTTELARTFGINPATAAKGGNRLVEAGLLYKKRGIGMFVADGALALLRSRRQADFAQNQLQRMAKEAGSLGLSKALLLELVSAAADREGLV
ncbi:MAG: GntR family transcriptional regulator [Faecalibacterium sp.]|nr:GntR family transcriptional regulator [Faecalibacterium sp.]